jgi:hypothetical protein
LKNKKFLTILFLEFLVVAGIAGYFLIDSADIYKFIAGDIKFYEMNKDCDLHKTSCSVEVPNFGKITFDITPKDIPLMKELTFKVTSSVDVDEFDMNIFATNMNMGYHQFKLKKIADKTYEAKGILPTCVVGGMIWRAEVINGRKGAVFIFKTK